MIDTLFGKKKQRLKEGRWKEYNKHAVLMSVGPYLLGHKHGHWMEYYDTGELMLEETYENGILQGRHPELGHKGINALLVETSWPGVTIGAKEDKSWASGASDTHSIMYNDVKVPKANRIGEDGFGFKFAMKVLSGGRIGIAAQALGIAAGAYELAVRYSKEREAFGKPISQHQAIAFKLADMATEIEAARLLVYRAAWLKDQGMDYTSAAAMAKLFASEVAMRHTVEAVQVHGGYGYVKEYHVERLMRDARITQIYEGTSEIQKVVISRNILNGQLYEPLWTTEHA